MVVVVVEVVTPFPVVVVLMEVLFVGAVLFPVAGTTTVVDVGLIRPGMKMKPRMMMITRIITATIHPPTPPPLSSGVGLLMTVAIFYVH